MVIGDHCIGVVGVVGVVVVGDVSLLDEADGVADWVGVVSGMVAVRLSVVVFGVVVGEGVVDSSSSEKSLGRGAGSAQRSLSLLAPASESLGVGAGSAHFSPLEP